MTEAADRSAPATPRGAGSPARSADRAPADWELPMPTMYTDERLAVTTESDDERRKAIRDAVEKCAETVNRGMLSLLAVALFCLLTTFGGADRSLVASDASIRLPFAEVPISFVGFLVVAPLLLIVLTVYLHVFYGYWRELDTVRLAQGLTETYPTLFGIDRKIAHLLTAFIFYWLTPLVVAAIAWKALARYEWGLSLILLTFLVTAGLVLLQAVRLGPGKWRRILITFVGALGILMLAAASTGVLSRGLLQRRLSLPGADLTSVDLRWANLQGANLVGADLTNVDLQGASLTKASLARAKLTGADLRGVNLAGADFTRADLTKAKLVGATLARVSLTRADLPLADLARANLTAVNLAEADLAKANLHRADLPRADLAEANLDRANLAEADLTAAKLTAASLLSAILTQAVLTEADLTRANLTGANLTKANFTKANLSKADLSETKGLTCDQIRDAITDNDTKLPTGLNCKKN